MCMSFDQNSVGKVGWLNGKQMYVRKSSHNMYNMSPVSTIALVTLEARFVCENVQFT
jgi:hypothetical protein